MINFIFIRISGEYVFESIFLIYFHLIHNCSAIGRGKKFVKCLLTGWENILPHNVFGDKIIQNRLKIDATY